MRPRIFSAMLFLLPVVSFAQSSKTLKSISDELFGFLSGNLLYVVMSLGLVTFFFGVALYIYRSGDKQNLEYARGILLWGVVGLAVMFSVGGIVYVLQQTLGVKDNTHLPKIDERDYQINTGYSR